MKIINNIRIRIIDFVKNTMSRRLLCIILAGLILRIVLVPFVFNFDMGFFVVTGSRFESGRTLYGLGEYHYPPVYGYFLSVFTYFWNLFSIRIGTTSELLVNDLAASDFQLTYISSLPMAMMYKLPLILIDFACSWLIYDLIRTRKGDTRRAELGFALFFLSPLVIWASSVAGMFDSLSAFFLIFSIYALVKDQYALSGAAMSMGFFTKIFPIVTGFAIIYYIVSKNKGEWKNALKCSLHYILGFSILTIVILLPIAMNGEMTAFINSVIGNRVIPSYTGSSIPMKSILGFKLGFATIFPILFIIVAVACSITFMQKYDSTEKYIVASTLSICIFFIWLLVPTYSVVAIAPISLTIAYCGRKEWIIPWILFSTLTVVNHITIFRHRLLYTIANETSLLDLSAVIEAFSQSNMSDIIRNTDSLMYIPGLVSLFIAIYYFRRMKGTNI